MSAATRFDPTPAAAQLDGATTGLVIGAEPPRCSAWLVSLYYTHDWNHGNHLRLFALAREWVRRGAEVHFVATRFEHSDPAQARAYLEDLRNAQIITGFHEIVLQHPRVRGKLARAALLPWARDVILGPERRPVLRQLDGIARSLRPDIFVHATRHLLYAVPRLRRWAPVVVDWIDSWALYHARQMRVTLADHNWRQAGAAAWRMLEQAVDEGCYSGWADANVFVSPVDARTHARYSGAVVRTVGNGIRGKFEPRARETVPNRLIFTGAMDFPPNHQAAVWFIRRVLPYVVAAAPHVRFVVAGANPLPELVALAGDHVEVTGYVDDMRAEMARSALYVAPLVSGSGFKNKVVEALAAGLNVVGTPMAFEFLDARLRSLFHAADDPKDLARFVIDALGNPTGNDAGVERFWQMAGSEFEWEDVARRFAAAVGRRKAA